MKCVIQRVYRASLKTGNKTVSEIGKGAVAYFCVEKGDNMKKCERFAQKLSKLRIFEDENGKMNLSILDVGGELLFVSQFTLAADLSCGNRPSFFNAEEPKTAEVMYLQTAEILKKSNVPVKLGVFGADMTIEQINNGPVTVIYSE